MNTIQGDDMGLEQAGPAAEAASGAAGAIWKLAGLAGGAGVAAALAAFVVMCATQPRNKREWGVALGSTLAFSIFGGAAVIRHFGLQVWAEDYIGIVGLAGVVFACGLPGWSIVRWWFNFAKKREDSGLDEIAREVRKQLAGQDPG